MEPEDPVAPAGESTPAPSGRNARIVVFLVVLLAIVLTGILLLRRGGTAPGGASPSPAADGKAPPPGLNVVEAPVKLTPEASLVADRFKCLCGQCQDTLGKCVCTRDKGSNDMKTALNRIVAEKKTLAEIDAAMVEKFGPGVLAGTNPAGNAPAAR